MSQQHGGDYSYIQKTARHDGPHAANVTGSAYEAHIITVTSAVYSISMKSIFASAAIGSPGVVTHCINITIVCSVGTLVDIYM